MLSCNYCITLNERNSFVLDKCNSENRLMIQGHFCEQISRKDFMMWHFHMPSGAPNAFNHEQQFLNRLQSNLFLFVLHFKAASH